MLKVGQKAPDFSLPNQDDINIFIAGCGTNQAIYHALVYPNSNIYAIDLSENSISHNKKMIEKYCAI